MSKLTLFLKKLVLSVLVLAIGLAALPAAGVAAAGLQDETASLINHSANGITVNPTIKFPFQNGAQDNERLEIIWDHLQDIYQRQGNRLAKADDFIARVQTLIDKANLKGWDTSAVQAALDAFAAVIPAAQAAYNPGAAIIAGHNGFNPAGKVTDRDEAIQTVKALTQVIKNTRAAMNGTGQALLEVIKAFREAHRPADSTSTP